MENKLPIRGWVSDGYKDVSGEVSSKNWFITKVNEFLYFMQTILQKGILIWFR